MITDQNRKIILAAIFVMLTGNLSLFQRIFEVYPLSAGNAPFLLSITAFFTITTVIFFLVICHGRLGNWILALFLLAASQAAYYMDSYGVIIDNGMIDNIVQTNPQEFAGLISPGLILRTLFLGIIPAWLVLKFQPRIQSFKTELKSKLLLILILVVALVAVVAPLTANYASFIREHKIVRLYANPTYFTYSIYQYLSQYLMSSEVTTLKITAPDATIVEAGSAKELVILVIGETARADRFSLNGYQRETNPELKKQKIISFSNVSSCGTSTGESVPCMFSSMKRSGFDRGKALHVENVLDVLFKHGVQVLWRDNNSDSKGVATRMQYENFRTPTLNPVCDNECRDIGMLEGLDRYIEARKDKDILIVLHQMGNHGPEYYRRYPHAFERFKPACKSGELNTCSKEEIDNAYDNAILYTDYFLANVIELLKKYDGQFETAMLYLSDHGESLGEHGIYLHAAPYVMAPAEQTHVPAILWMGEHFDYRLDQLKPYQNYDLSHDDLFCMLFVAFEVESKTCEGQKKILVNSEDFTETRN